MLIIGKRADLLLFDAFLKFDDKEIVFAAWNGLSEILHTNENIKQYAQKMLTQAMVVKIMHLFETTNDNDSFANTLSVFCYCASVDHHQIIEPIFNSFMNHIEAPGDRNTVVNEVYEGLMHLTIRLPHLCKIWIEYLSSPDDCKLKTSLKVIALLTTLVEGETHIQNILKTSSYLDIASEILSSSNDPNKIGSICWALSNMMAETEEQIISVICHPTLLPAVFKMWSRKEEFDIIEHIFFLFINATIKTRKVKVLNKLIEHGCLEVIIESIKHSSSYINRGLPVLGRLLMFGDRENAQNIHPYNHVALRLIEMDALETIRQADKGDTLVSTYFGKRYEKYLAKESKTKSANNQLD